MSELNRLLIASTAVWQAIVGAHYLKGGWGAYPKSSEYGRPVKLMENHSYDSLAIHTAQNGLQTCYGRWGATGLGGHLFPKSDKTTASLMKYIAANESAPTDDAWTYYEKPNLFPRRLNGSDSAIALGEDCRNKRHFDCIGFIYWVLLQVAPNGAWNQYGISNYEKGFDKVERLGKMDATGLSIGDIVTNTNSSPKHIAFYTGFNRVVHASIENKGVVVSTYDEHPWTGACRIKPEYL